MCDCVEAETSPDWGDEYLRLEALKLATSLSSSVFASSGEIVAKAADFYNFLNGALVTSNIDKLAAIADILADE